MQDDQAAMNSIDRSGMLKVLSDFPHQLEKAREIGRAYSPTFKGKFDWILFTGMGGSAIGGHMASSLLKSVSDVPVTVNRNYTVPTWIGSRSLVIAISYSGETEETIAAAREALKRGSRVVAVCSGGTLAQVVKKGKGDAIIVPGGLQPRAALGLLAIPPLYALERFGLMKADERVRDAIKVVSDVSARIRPDVPMERNESKKLATEIHGTTPVIYGVGPYTSVARRIANQMSENAKVMAFAGALPEMDHNDLVGWSGEDKARHFSATFITDGTEGSQMKARLDLTRRLIGKRAKVLEIKPEGKRLLSKILSATHVGDFASVYVALGRGVDPTPVDVIGELKTGLAEAAHRKDAGAH
jgi:glucose/mannose-6-phosphate isomerase